MSATYGKEIKFGGPGGQEVTDAAFYYDVATQTLHVTNLTAGDLVFSGETIVSPTYTGAIVLGTSGSDTVDVTATLTFNTAPTLATNKKLLFRDSGLYINSASDGKLTISSDGVGADDITMDGTVTFSAAVQNNAIITVGVDGTGYDVLFYSATAGKSWLWDESADKMIVTGASQFSGNIIVGIDDTGYDVTFFGATTGKYFLWDESADGVVLVGTMTQTGNAAITGTLGVTGATTVTSASATSLTVGRLGATTPAFTVDSSTGSQVAGFKVTGAATGGTVALVVTDSGANASLTVNAKGSGTIGIGTVSTGIVTITPATTVTGLLTLTAGIAAKFILASTETIAAGGTTTALDLTKTCHNIDADAGGDIFTLADGIAGQTMIIIMKSATGIATVTPTTKTGFTSVTMNAAGESVVLQFFTTLGWIIIGGNAYTVV